MPPPNAEFVVTRDPYKFVNSSEYLWTCALGCDYSLGGPYPNTIHNFVYSVDGEVILRRKGYTPDTTAPSVNGGVVYETTDVGDTWELDWPSSN
jgi:hypothetical protein